MHTRLFFRSKEKYSIITNGDITKSLTDDNYVLSLVKADGDAHSSKILIEGVNAANKRFVKSYALHIDNSQRQIKIIEALKYKKYMLPEDCTFLSFNISKAQAEKFDVAMRDEQQNLDNTHRFKQSYTSEMYSLTSYTWARARLTAKLKDVVNINSIPERPENFKFSSEPNNIWTYHDTPTCRLPICGR